MVVYCLCIAWGFPRMWPLSSYRLYPVIKEATTSKGICAMQKHWFHLNFWSHSESAEIWTFMHICLDFSPCSKKKTQGHFHNTQILSNRAKSILMSMLHGHLQLLPGNYLNNIITNANSSCPTHIIKDSNHGSLYNLQNQSTCAKVRLTVGSSCPCLWIWA